MKDKLEKFIIRNREEFDNKIPDDLLWSKIENKLYGGRYNRASKTVWIWKAAAITLLISSSLLLMDKFYFSDGFIKKSQLVSNEFEDIEDYYIGQINLKEEEINEYLIHDPHINSDFKDELGKLDAMYLVLKNNLDKNPSQEVVDALILNLIMRIDILNSHLIKLERQSSEGKEPISSS